MIKLFSQINNQVNSLGFPYLILEILFRKFCENWYIKWKTFQQSYETNTKNTFIHFLLESVAVNQTVTGSIFAKLIIFLLNLVWMGWSIRHLSYKINRYVPW